MPKYHYGCRVEMSNVFDKKVYVPYLKEGKRFIQPKFTSLGEKEEYPTRKQCLKRCSRLDKTKKKR